MKTLKAPRSWCPDRPVSKGATAYHNVIINSSWHNQNILELMNIVDKKIKDGDIVVDFGAGTGGSAVYLLRKLRTKFSLWLVDNSASWLSKAYELLGKNLRTRFFLLEKIKRRNSTLSESLGKEIVNHVISANTIHLVPNLEETLIGIYESLKPEGTFTFQSGNIIRSDREEGILMIDDTVKRVHEISLDILRTNKKFKKYKTNLRNEIESEADQRKFVFPNPKPIEFYLNILRLAGFIYKQPHYKLIKVRYKDWLNFLRVRRLQAGILPEIGGKDPSPVEEHDRDELITIASKQLFKELETSNRFSNDKCFTAEWVYVPAVKT